MIYQCSYNDKSRLVRKPTKSHVLPAKTQISLGIRPVWSESSLSAWRKLGSLATHWAHREESDQIGRMPRLIWVFAGHTDHFVGFVMRWLIRFSDCPYTCMIFHSDSVFILVKVPFLHIPGWYHILHSVSFMKPFCLANRLTVGQQLIETSLHFELPYFLATLPYFALSYDITFESLIMSCINKNNPLVG